MKCYYCETEFSGNVCPKCLAVYTIAEEEVNQEHKNEEVESSTSGQRNEEGIKALVKEDKEEDKEKKGKGKKVEIILEVVDALADVIGSLLD